MTGKLNLYDITVLLMFRVGTHHNRLVRVGGRLCLVSVSVPLQSNQTPCRVGSGLTYYLPYATSKQSKQSHDQCNASYRQLAMCKKNLYLANTYPISATQTEIGIFSLGLIL